MKDLIKSSKIKDNKCIINKILDLANSFIKHEILFDDKLNFKYHDIEFNKNNFNIIGGFARITGYNTSNKKSIILKIPIEDSIENIKCEIKIHTLLNAFQKLYLKNNKIVTKLYKIFLNSNVKNTNNIIVQKKYNLDVYSYFLNLDFNLIENQLIMVSLLYQISIILIILQNEFSFVHNDLKPNNILFNIIDKTKSTSYDNIEFVLADFGGSYLEFNKVITCGQLRGSVNKFNSNKDIYMLVHLLYTFINKKSKKSVKTLFCDIFDKKNINTKYSKHDKNFSWFVYYDVTDIPDNFNPRNVYNKIIKLFPIIKKNNDILQSYYKII